jgi:BirA family biotin operon repressor/biotin-[acetyl-CoA-carboxylase] ligase
VTTAESGGLPPDLAAALARAEPRLAGFVSGLVYHDEVGSTNDEAMRRSAEGAPAGTVVLAGRQTAGRGRHGRSWHSPPGAGLYLSVLLRPDSEASRALVTLMAGVAAADAVQRVAGLEAVLKWPNDLVTVTPAGRRKLGGILAEASVMGSRPTHIVLGIGINVRRAALPAELAAIATSIEGETGLAVAPSTLAAELLAALAGGWRLLQAGERQAVLSAWRARARPLLGHPVRWAGGGEGREGVARDIDDTGALIVDTPWGPERVVAGEVLWA